MRKYNKLFHKEIIESGWKKPTKKTNYKLDLLGGKPFYLKFFILSFNFANKSYCLVIVEPKI